MVQSSHCCLDEELLWRENVWSCCRDHQLTAFPASSTLPWPPLPFHIGGGPPIGNINHCCVCCLLWEQLKISKLVQLKALPYFGLADSAVVEIRLKPEQSSHDFHRPKCTYMYIVHICTKTQTMTCPFNWVTPKKKLAKPTKAVLCSPKWKWTMWVLGMSVRHHLINNTAQRLHRPL